MSTEKTVNCVYRILDEIAGPGDLLFCISERDREISGATRRSNSPIAALRHLSKPLYKQWFGRDKYDFDIWHVCIFFTAKKRKTHSRINPWIIHSTSEKGVTVGIVTPKYFTRDSSCASRRIELLGCRDIDEFQRNRIIEFAYSKVGSEFDNSRYTFLPYAFGLPNFFYDKNKFSCQQLVIASYAAAGIYFPHPFESFPIFNIGKYLGHPLGHPPDHVNPEYPYLMDHHIYRDPRFTVKAAVYQDAATAEIILERCNLTKYAWNEVLREKYKTDTDRA